MRFFKTETPQIGIMCPGGVRIQWRVDERGFGFLETEEEEEIAAVTRCIQRKIGGIVSEITQAEFESVKKNLQRQARPGRRSIEFLDAPNTQMPAQSSPAPAAPAVVPSSVASEPEPAPAEKPKLGKRR